MSETNDQNAAGTTQEPAGGQNQSDGTQNTANQAATAPQATPGAQDNGATPLTLTAEQQEAVNRLIADRLSRAKEGWEKAQADAAEKARTEKERQELEANKEYEKLLLNIRQENATLKARADEADSLREAILASVEKQIQKLDKATQFLVQKLPLAEQIQYLNEFGAQQVKQKPPETNASATTTAKTTGGLKDVAAKYGINI